MRSRCGGHVARRRGPALRRRLGVGRGRRGAARTAPGADGAGGGRRVVRAAQQGALGGGVGRGARAAPDGALHLLPGAPASAWRRSAMSVSSSCIRACGGRDGRVRLVLARHQLRPQPCQARLRLAEPVDDGGVAAAHRLERPLGVDRLGDAARGEEDLGERGRVVRRRSPRAARRARSRRPARAASAWAIAAVVSSIRSRSSRARATAAAWASAAAAARASIDCDLGLQLADLAALGVEHVAGGGRPAGRGRRRRARSRPGRGRRAP